MQETRSTQDLPPDNASRLAIYDALYERVSETKNASISDDELFARVIGRLRVLVPRELHLTGDRNYVDEKIEACIQANIISASSEDGRRLLTLTGEPPLVRYPDGELRAYTPGLELARERLDRDNARLRAASFDVRKLIPSIADEPDGAPFQALLGSMRELGFMKQFPVIKHEDGIITDGIARIRAASILGLDVEYLKYASVKERKASHLRDTPVDRILVAVHSNTFRLSDDLIEAVYESASEVTGRAWSDTAADLGLTKQWRHSKPSEYTPRFEVTKLAYREGDEPKIQVTADHKVMVRSLIEAGGLASYKIDTQLSQYVPFERARSAFSGGRKAIFARAEDLIAGIAAMQQDRQAANRKMDPEWGNIRDWLVRTFEPVQE